MSYNTVLRVHRYTYTRIHVLDMSKKSRISSLYLKLYPMDYSIIEGCISNNYYLQTIKHFNHLRFTEQ